MTLRFRIKMITALGLLAGLWLPVSAQDLLVLQNDEEVIAKVTGLSRWHVEYLPYANQDQDPIRLPKAEISYIVFEDGMKQYFSPEDIPPVFVVTTGDSGAIPDSLKGVDLYDAGVAAAEQYYQRKGPFWGSLGATAFYPIAGLFTGLVTSVVIGAVPPTIDPEDTPDPVLFVQNQSYAEGYRDQARRNKVKEVAKGFGIGAGLQAVVIIILIATF